jgi:hypothetical protein
MGLTGHSPTGAAVSEFIETGDFNGDGKSGDIHLASRLARIELARRETGEPLWVARRLVQHGNSIRDMHGNEIDEALRRRIERRPARGRTFRHARD